MYDFLKPCSSRYSPLLGMLIIINACAAQTPTFNEYAADEIYSDVLQQVDLSSHPDAGNFATRLGYSVGEEANFAGHYIVTYWGCGTSCQMVAIIDAIDGRIFFPADFTASYGVCYQRESKLLIINQNPSAPNQCSKSSLTLL